jgi:hypothetical protein
MNPYLEQDDVWRDFHKRFLPAAAELIGVQVQPAYIVKFAAGLLDVPAHVRLPAVDIGGESFIEIRDRRSRELVCVIELLSPANKRPGPDREQYLVKRGKLLNSPAHLVEIDLLRAGNPMPSEDRPNCAYSVAVSRVEDRLVAGFWPIGPRDPLPDIPIPLRQPHPDARLDLQGLPHRIYDAAGYAYYIYESTPSPALAPDDAIWARQLMPAANP